MEFSAIWQQCPRTKSAAASPAFHMGMYHVQEVANEFIPMNVYEGGGVLVATGVGKRKKAIWMKEQGSVDVCNVHLHTLKDTCILL